jgi:hypothetical protein
MRRILLVLSMAALMAAMLVASALHAFAQQDVTLPPQGTTYGHCVAGTAQNPAASPGAPSRFNEVFDPFDPVGDEGPVRNGKACMRTTGGGA